MREQQLVNRARAYGWVIAIAIVLALLAWKHFAH